MKKLLYLLTAAIMVFTFTACGNENKPEEQTTAQQEEFSEELSDVVNSSTTLPENESTSENETEVTNPVEEESSTEEEIVETDPAKWTDEQIIEYYKAAAAKTHPHVKSVQTMTLKELEVNEGDGLLGTLVEMITPFFVSALEKNSIEIDGITGGYSNLKVSDAKSIKAYKSGKYTVIEMTMKEQTDGKYADQFSGTVGHAITVLGDISVVEKELPQFDIGLDEADISLTYKNPILRVKIDENGIIESGEWSYTVFVKIANLRVDAVRIPLGATVKTGYGSVDYRIVLN
ncbi:MAG: hypothetical protein IJA02_02105 [Clostridia bacterium]|nr:hypothetical protein [Clostridia bacterium]